MAINEVRALRIVLACLADEDGEAGLDAASQAIDAVWDEITCGGCVEQVAEILASKVAALMVTTTDPAGSARAVEARIAGLLDFASGEKSARRPIC